MTSSTEPSAYDLERRFSMGVKTFNFDPEPGRVLKNLVKDEKLYVESMDLDSEYDGSLCTTLRIRGGNANLAAFIGDEITIRKAGPVFEECMIYVLRPIRWWETRWWEVAEMILGLGGGLLLFLVLT